MKDFLIIGIPILILMVLYLLSFEKRLKNNSYIMILAIMIAFGYGGYLLGSANEFTASRLLLVILFFISGLWRLIQFTKIKIAS
jgi:uncharacterized ion transporter superfamily protein YfcC